MQSNRTSTRYNPDAAVQPVQIMVFALMAGVVVFGAFATFRNLNRQEQPEDSLMPLIAAAFAAIAVAMRFIVGRLIVGVQMQVARRQAMGDDESKVRDAIYGVFQTVTIMQNAMLEGAAFFVLIMFLVFGQWWLLGVAAALVALMLVTFPTKGRIEHFINEHKQQWDFEGDR